jgi:hypothetical protein
MTAPRRLTLFDRQVEAVRQHREQRVPVYLSRQDWQRLWTHLRKGNSHLPITVRLIAAIEAQLSPRATEPISRKEGQ